MDRGESDNSGQSTTSGLAAQGQPLNDPNHPSLVQARAEAIATLLANTGRALAQAPPTVPTDAGIASLLSVAANLTSAMAERHIPMESTTGNLILQVRHAI
jgi:hypothetical protein